MYFKKIFFAGGLFEESNSMEEIAFKYAVDNINRSEDNCKATKSQVLFQEQLTAQVHSDGSNWENS